MKKLPIVLFFSLAVVLAVGFGARSVQGQSGTTISWTNSGNPGQTCLALITVDGQPSSGYFFCPNQVDGFTSPDYINVGSLYLPGVTLEDMPIVWGSPIPTSYNTDGTVSTFDETGTFGEFGWTGTTTQHYKYVKYYGARNHVLIKIVTLGGSGSVTD